MGKKKQTVGYWYGLGFHAVYGQGEADAVSAVRVGERIAWEGWANSNTDLSLRNRELFGGEAREGGIDGTLRIRLGGPDQQADPYLQSRIGGPVPAFRGVLSAIWDGLVAANNPYIKPWSLRAFRKPKLPFDSLPGRPNIFLVDSQTHAVNAAWIVFECLHNPEWGAGEPLDEIDVDSFAVCAGMWRPNNGLRSSGHLSIEWTSESTIDAFIQLVLRHVDGVLFRNPQNAGRWTLRYVDATTRPWPLPRVERYGPHNVLAVESFARPALAELVNEVTVRWRDWDTDEPQTLTVQNPAAVETMGGVSATTIDYPGIVRREDAWKIAMRDLRSLSYPTAQLTFIANRDASCLLPCDLIYLDWPELDIANLRLRVINVGYGAIDDGRVRVQCVEDALSFNNFGYAPPPEGGVWQPIDYAPHPPEHVEAIELPYYLVAREIARGTETGANELKPDDAFVALLASRPPGVPLRIEARVYGQLRGEGAWTPTATLATSLPAGEGPATVALTNRVALEQVQPGGTALAAVGSELFRVDALDLDAGTVTLARGVADTVPTSHPAGARIWFIDDRIDLDERWVAGESLAIQAITIASAGRLAGGPAATITTTGRQHLPYPPARLRVNGVAYPASATGAVTVAWSHRNRRTQTADLIDQTAGDIGPEPGVTYTLRAWLAGSLFETAANLATTSHALSPPGAGVLRVEIRAVRDSVTSHQALTWEGHYTP